MLPLFRGLMSQKDLEIQICNSYARLIPYISKLTQCRSVKRRAAFKHSFVLRALSNVGHFISGLSSVLRETCNLLQFLFSVVIAVMSCQSRDLVCKSATDESLWF
jgi:hypothetical protein